MAKYSKEELQNMAKIVKGASPHKFAIFLTLVSMISGKDPSYVKRKIDEYAKGIF